MRLLCLCPLWNKLKLMSLRQLHHLHLLAVILASLYNHFIFKERIVEEGKRSSQWYET